jgi:predicted RNA-binding Zn ribbon-like protein
METPGHISSLRVIGGNLALDFANTAEGTSEGEIEQEHLLGYEDLVFWGHRVEYLSAEDGERLLRKGDERPAEADTVFASALGFRGHLRGLFRAVAGGDNPPAESVEALRRFESAAISHAALAPTGGGFVWRWALGEDLGGVLWPVAHSATELMTSGPLGRVKGWMQLALCRREQEQEPSLVLDGRLRHPREDAPLRRAPGGQTQELRSKACLCDSL